MKRKSLFIRLTAFFAALYFVTAGMGHNIVNYCCNTCEDAGIEIIAHHSCGELHHPEVEEANGCCDFDMSEPGLASCPIEGSCEIKRLQLDSFSYNPVVLEQLSDKDLVACFTELYSVVAASDVLASFYLYPPPEPDTSSGREILSHKSVLII